jgi:hypothetical protein
MDDTELQKALLNYVIHIADNQTRIAEAMATLGQQVTIMNAQSQAVAAILERVVQTTDRSEQMVARILASGGEKRD